MIDVKNRTRSQLTYQYPRTVSAGPVRPQTQVVFRSEHNPKTGVVQRRERVIVVGGVLTIPPMGEIKNLPDVLLEHQGLARDIDARNVRVIKRPDPVRVASVARVEKATHAETPPDGGKRKQKKTSRK